MESVDRSLPPPETLLLPDLSALISIRKEQLTPKCTPELHKIVEDIHFDPSVGSTQKTDQMSADKDHGASLNTTSSFAASVSSNSRPLRYNREELFALRAFHEAFPGTSLQVLQELGPVMEELMGLKVVNSRGTRQRNVNRRHLHGNKSEKLGPATMISAPDTIWDGLLNQCDEPAYEGISSYGLGNKIENQPRVDLSNDSLIESNDSDGSEDDMDSFQQLAFVVHGEPNFDSGPPEDGLEYLRRVRWEAAQCPKVKVAKIAPEKLTSQQIHYIPDIPAIPRCDPNMLPSPEWEKEFLSDFTNLRMEFLNLSQETGCSFEPLPHTRNEKAWKVFCLGSAFSKADTAPVLENRDVVDEVLEDKIGPASSTGGISSGFENQEVDEVFENNSSYYDATAEDGSSDHDFEYSLPQDEGVTGLSPYLNVVKRMDEVSRAAIFRYHVSWLEDIEGLSEHRALWLFALAVAVDKPLNAETSAAFRTLLRRCAMIRARKKSQEDKELHILNILITIAGQYFGQADDHPGDVSMS